ncbi:hypothetical protein GQX74_014891 [Glossina fuscipes]|nr:hypothetical protein GQX74_014891 [Glossina fuscipes]
MFCHLFDQQKRTVAQNLHNNNRVKFYKNYTCAWNCSVEPILGAATSATSKRLRKCSACFMYGVIMSMDSGLMFLRFNLTVIRKTFKNEINVMKY